MRFDLSSAAVEWIVRDEVTKIGRVDNHGIEDLEQESRLAAARAVNKIEVGSSDARSKAYIRSAVQNALRNIKRNAHTRKRVPYDAWGRREYVDSLDKPHPFMPDVDMVDTVQDEEGDPEQRSTVRELLTAIEQRISEEHRDAFFRALEDSAHAVKEGRDLKEVRQRMETIFNRLVRTPSPIEMEKRSERILQSLAHRVDDGSPTKEKKKMTKLSAGKITLPVVKPEDLPECHAEAPEAGGRLGYAHEEVDCQNCADKFSCVKASIETSLVAGLTLETDIEVREVLMGRAQFVDVAQRLKQRRQLVKARSEIPDALLLVNFGKVEETETEEEEEEEATEEVASEEPGTEEDASEPTDDGEAAAEETENTESEKETTMAKKKTAKKTTTKAAAKPAKPAKPAAPAKPAKPAKPAPAAKPAKPVKAPAAKRIPSEKRVAISLPGGERYLPQPKELTPDAMATVLGRVQLGQPFDLGTGMQLVRKLRGGEEQVVTIKKNGFEFGGAIYPSLTAAAMWATQRSVNGNTHFGVGSQSCTEIRGPGVPNGRYSKEGSAKTPKAAAPKAAKKVEKAAAPKAAKKVAKAAPAKAAKKVAKAAPAKAAKKAPPPPPAKKKVAKKK